MLVMGQYSVGSTSTIAGGSGYGYVNGIGTNAKIRIRNTVPAGIEISPDGAYALFADSDNSVVRRLKISTKVVSLFAGIPNIMGSLDGSATSATFNNPLDIIFNFNVAYVADDNNIDAIRLITSTGTVSTLTTAATSSGLALSSDGTFILATSSNNHVIYKITVSGAAVTVLAGLSTAWVLRRGFRIHMMWISVLTVRTPSLLTTKTARSA